MSYANTVNQLAQGLDKYPEEFIRLLDKIQGRYMNEILPLLERLTLGENGVVLANAENFAISNLIRERSNLILAEVGYADALKKFAIGMNQQRALTDNLYKIVLDDSRLSFVEFDAMFAAAQRNAVTLVGEAAVQSFTTTLATTLDNSIASSTTFSELLNTIRTTVTGNADADGFLLRYGKQNAKDSFSVANRAYSEQLNQKYEVEWYRYSGALMDTSRPFCEKHHNKIYHKKEIEGWANDKWAGKVPTTNETTIFTYVGGYNCNHILTPVPLRLVPKDKIEEAKSKGWIE
jgi:hypothetical protein